MARSLPEHRARGVVDALHQVHSEVEPEGAGIPRG